MGMDELRVLLVDDDPAVLRAYGANLTRHGVEPADRVKAGTFDVIVSDISMPEMTGIDFLKAVRAYDLEVPVILVTGQPEVETAFRAVEHGAFRYLVKPVAGQELWDTAPRAATAQAGEAEGGRSAPSRRGAPATRRTRRPRSSRAWWVMSRMWMGFQPVVARRERRIFGYEALLRCDEPLMERRQSSRLGKVSAYRRRGSRRGTAVALTKQGEDVARRTSERPFSRSAQTSPGRGLVLDGEALILGRVAEHLAAKHRVPPIRRPVDLDRFKEVNDGGSHGASDDVLRRVATLSVYQRGSASSRAGLANR